MCLKFYIKLFNKLFFFTFANKHIKNIYKMIILKVLIWVVVATAAGILAYFIGGKNKIIKILLQLVLFAAICFLGFTLYSGIQEPIEFKEEKDMRYRATVKELINIKNAQIAFKKEKGKYAASFDTLIYFVKNDSITEIKREGIITDSIWSVAGNKRSEAEKIALKLGIISRDTIKISTLDSLFKKYDINELGKVPFTKGEMFKLDTATIETSGLTLHVFEASVHNNILLNGLNRELILNLNDDAIRLNRDIENEARKKYTGLKVGSLLENNNNEGNWEKIYELDK